jgi:release factor glutamine methyltransferase
MQVQQLLNTAVASLAGAEIEDGRLEAELLLRHCLGVSRSELFLLHDQPVRSKQKLHFQELLRRRCLREPLQYILGSCEFWSLDFHVTPAVLIPRPETEFLLEHSFSTLAEAGDIRPRHVLDLCTGSGVIAVVLAKELAGAEVTAVDCSRDALAVARDNISLHGLNERIHLLCADLLTCFRPTSLFDLIVTNPPYVKADDLPLLDPEVRDWEPELALSGGGSGTDSIELICRDAVRCLRPGGWLFMEIGADIGEPVERVFLRDGQYERVMVVRDWAGRPRVLQARKRR